MGNFVFSRTGIDGVYLIDTKIFGDERGYFQETYKETDFRDAGLDYRFVQDNQSRSRRGVLRGLHYQKEYPQAKLVRVTEGEVFDVAVDIRNGSPTFGKWVGAVLSETNRRQIMIPGGFAHGFLVLSEYATLCYKCDEVYHPEDEAGIRWDDPEIGIEWPFTDGLTLSEKDKKHPSLKDSGVGN